MNFRAAPGTPLVIGRAFESSTPEPGFETTSLIGTLKHRVRTPWEERTAFLFDMRGC